MSWYEDLTPFADLGPKGAACLAVGWLERGRPFATGPVDHAVFKRLVELLQHPWEPAITVGFHQCDLLYDGPHGKRNLYLPTEDAVFVCPELITAHGYRPPGEFCAAVLACPPMR